ncbi:MAG: hypothetical protein KIT08_02645 [Anaerolineales bacterium]|nr:MAG: hypothetical protein KIT08_02645 [Anaerolineales bacterium]
MNEHDKDRKDEKQSVRPPQEGEEHLPDGAIHRTPERDPRQGAQRRTEEPDRENQETPN